MAVGGPGPGSRSLTRASAFLTLLLAPVMLEPALASGADGYMLILLVAVAGGAVLAAVQIWRSGGVVTQMMAATLAGLILVVQVAVCLFGGPTGSPPHWSAMAVLLVVLAVLALGALTTDVRLHAQIGADTDERPYAL